MQVTARTALPKQCWCWWLHEVETVRFWTALQNWRFRINTLFTSDASSFQRRTASFPKSHVFYGVY